jgi:N-acetylglucosaminyl-diphospho-decaprenol L-rhamnosyltransferase
MRRIEEVQITSVDVIVVTYRSAECVRSCLEAAGDAPQVERLIIVDNASDDGSADVARAAGASVVFENDRNVGFARAVNLGLREATADLVLLLNPDAVCTGDALERLVACLDGDSGAVMAGPMLQSPAGEVTVGARRFSTVVNRLLWHVPLPSRPAWSTPEYVGATRAEAIVRPTPVDYLWGAALLCRRSFLSSIGGLDERFFLYSEDEDLGRRARSLGLRSVLVPEAVVRHTGGASTTDEALAWARIESSTASVLAKWNGPAAGRAFRAGIVPVLGARAAVLAAAGRGREAEVAWRVVRLLRGAPWPEAADAAGPDGVSSPGRS